MERTHQLVITFSQFGSSLLCSPHKTGGLEMTLRDRHSAVEVREKMPQCLLATDGYSITSVCATALADRHGYSSYCNMLGNIRETMTLNVWQPQMVTPARATALADRHG